MRDSAEPQPKEPSTPAPLPNVIKDETEQAAAQQCQLDHERFDRLMTAFEATLKQLADDKRSTRVHNWVTTVIGVAGAFIIGGQLWVTRDQLQEMQSSSADTKLLADATKRQADYTERLMALNNDPVLSVHAPDNGPFL